MDCIEVGRLYRLKQGTYMQDEQHRKLYRFDTDYKVEHVSLYYIYLNEQKVIDTQYFKHHFELAPIELRKDKLKKLI